MINNEVLTVIISSITGLIGYLLREWQNHSRPFISTVNFEGDYFTGNTEITLDPEITQKMEKTFYIDNLKNNTTLREIHTAKDQARYISDYAPEIISRIDEFIGSIKKDESNLLIFKSLSNLFSVPNIDSIIGNLLLNGKIPIFQNLSNEYVFGLSESSKINDGCYILSYQGGLIGIGTQFNEDSYIKELFEPLIQTIRVLDKNNIIAIFEAIKVAINQELIVANFVINKLNNILDENSKWEIELFIANLKRTPLLLENLALLHVKDKTGATFCEECTLVVHEFDTEGNVNKKISKSPIIIPNGGNVTISYFTKKSQKEMERGEDFRNAYTHKQAKAWLTLSMTGVGLIKKRIYNTNKKIFTE